MEAPCLCVYAASHGAAGKNEQPSGLCLCPCKVCHLRKENISCPFAESLDCWKVPGLTFLVCPSPCPSGTAAALPVAAARCEFEGRPLLADLCPSTCRVTAHPEQTTGSSSPCRRESTLLRQCLGTSSRLYSWVPGEWVMGSGWTLAVPGLMVWRNIQGQN